MASGRRNRFGQILIVLFAFIANFGCGGNSAGSQGPPPPPSISIVPTAGLTHVGGDLVMMAPESVTWSVQGCSGGASVCGTFSNSDCFLQSECFVGYLAPAVVPPGGQVTVVATSTQDPTMWGSATVVVNPINFASATYAAGNGPESVVVADFNGDGKLDLAVADNGNSSTGDNGGVSILLGNGDGTFRPAQSFSAGKNPTFITAGDFNGDGKMDLAVSDQGELPSGGNGNLSVLLGNGDGTFQSPITVNAGFGPYAQVLGDFNGDGKLDIAVINYGDLPASNYGAVSILLGNGDGTFQAPAQVNAGETPSSVATAIVAGDFNGDGKLDLAVTATDTSNSSPTSSVGVLLGNGDGTFQAPAFYGKSEIPTSLAAGDLKGNGRIDLAVTAFALNPLEQQATSSIAVMFGNGDGTFQPAQSVSTTYEDYVPDIPFPCTWQGLKFRGVNNICFPMALQVADFDGSGKPDLVGIGAGSFLLPGNGDGTYEGILVYPGTGFQGAWPVPGGNGAGLVVADLNGDGKPDIVSTWEGDEDTPPNVTVLLNETVPFGAHAAEVRARATIERLIRGGNRLKRSVLK